MNRITLIEFLVLIKSPGWLRRQIECIHHVETQAVASFNSDKGCEVCVDVELVYGKIYKLSQLREFSVLYTMDFEFDNYNKDSLTFFEPDNGHWDIMEGFQINCGEEALDKSSLEEDIPNSFCVTDAGILKEVHAKFINDRLTDNPLASLDLRHLK